MRRRELLTLAASGILATGALAAVAAPAQAGLLDRYRWKRRLVLVFAPVKPHPSLVVQRKWLKEAADGLAERDMTVVEVVQDWVYVNGQPTIELNAKALRQEFNASIIEFSVVLIGKDGGEKLRRDEPQTAARLFDVVDAMPMRRHEMRQREKEKRERES